METEDPARMANTGAWLRLASRDMRAAAHGMKADPPLLGDVVFHCQQGAEKAMRGFLAWHGVEAVETSDLREIGRRCVELDSSLQPLVEQAAPLSDYAWKYRYPLDPDEPEEPTADEVHQAMSITHAVATEILERLPEDIHHA